MSVASGWVAYVGPFLFPWGQPCSRRVYGIARSLAEVGHHVVVCSGADAPARLTVLDECLGPGSVAHVGLGEQRPAVSGQLRKAEQYLLRWGQRTVEWLDALPSRPSHVLLYGGQAPYGIRLRRWCRRHRVPLIADVVEWYSPRQLRYGVLGPSHASAQVALRYVYPRCDGVIAVSSYLERYYRHRGNKVLRVPPTLDVRGLAPSGARAAGVADRRHLVVAYAGSPGRKDLIGTIMRAVGVAHGAGVDIELHVLGPTPQQLRALLGGQSPPPGVRVLGSVPQQEVPRIIQQADFTVLLREPARFAQAGFSTKFCESLACGTPVIANLTGDIGMYLRDQVTGLVCPDHSVRGLSQVLLDAAALSGPQRTRMSQAARACALASFDFRVHADSLGAFLDQVRI